MLLFIGFPEIVVILLFIVMFFGSKKIPELAKGLGKVMREVIAEKPFQLTLC